jgi:hypothetical protein
VPDDIELLGRHHATGHVNGRSAISANIVSDPVLQRSSGDEQAKAKLCCIESDEVAVAFGPPA